MAKVKTDFSEASKLAFTPGKHIVVMTKAEVEISKKGNQMIVGDIVKYGDEYTGLTIRLMLTGKGAGGLKSYLSAIGMSTDISELDTDDLIGKPLIGKFIEKTDTYVKPNEETGEDEEKTITKVEPNTFQGEPAEVAALENADEDLAEQNDAITDQDLVE